VRTASALTVSASTAPIFGAIDVVERRTVDDHVRRRVSNRSRDRCRVADIERRMCVCHDRRVGRSADDH
jgi:hypothetical protein